MFRKEMKFSNYVQGNYLGIWVVYVAFGKCGVHKYVFCKATKVHKLASSMFFTFCVLYIEKSFETK